MIPLLCSLIKIISTGRYKIITCLMIPIHLSLVAQVGLNEFTISLMKGTVEPGTKLMELKPNSLVLQLKTNKTKHFTVQEIPVGAVKDISVRYGYSNGRGALNGLVGGSLAGLSIGLLAEATNSESDFTGVYAVGGLFMGASLGSLFGFVIGGKKNKRFRINGNLENYKHNLPKIQELLIKK